MIAIDKLRAAAKAAIKQNEGGNYNLSCAGVAESGYSFGFGQGDIRTDEHAWGVLHAILAAAVSAGTLTAGELGVVEDNRETLCAGANPISGLLPKINRILNEPAARQTIDAMDDGLFQDAEAQTVGLFQAADQAWGRSLGLTEAGALAMWSNMTGGLAQTTNRIAHDLIQPRWTRFRDLVAFLRASKYFRDHPHNLVHFLESIALGLRDALGDGGILGGDLSATEVADLNAELQNVGSGVRLTV